MKKIVSLLIVASMLLTVCVSGFAAMTSNEMYEALTGVHASNPYGTESGLIDAYKNVSPAQMEAIKVFKDKLDATDYTDAANTVWTTVNLTETETALVEEEIRFILGMSELIAYAEDALDVNSYFKGSPLTENSPELKNLLVSKLETESDVFYGGAYEILNKYSKDLLTKDAFGGLIIDLKDKFLKVIKTNINDLTAAFTSNDQNAYAALIEDYFVKALVEVVSSPAYPEFAKNAVPAMVETGFIDGTNAENSKFVKWVKDTFKFVKAVDADVLCVLANTIISSIADIDIVYDSTRVAPNKAVALGAEGSVTFTIRTAEETFKGSSVGYELDLDLTKWFDLKLINYDGTAFADAVITANDAEGTFTITGKNSDRVAKYGVLQLYRNATANQGNDSATHQLFAEFQIVVSKKSTGGGGGGGGSATSKYEITFMADGKVLDHVDVVNGKLTKVPEAPEKDGYNFIGWSVDGETSIDPTTVELSKNTVFYALYREIPTMDKENHFAYVIGYEDGEFKPEKNITRAEAATIFSRLIVKKIDVKDDYTTKFTDVDANAWYYEYVSHMETVGVIAGYPDGTFRPDAPITRAEFATMASRFDKLAPSGESFFNDVTAEHWAYNYIESAATKGWVKGDEDGSFRPDDSITREETVTIVNRMLERSADKEYVEANAATIIDYSDIDNTRWSYYEIIEASNSHLYNKTEGVETWTSVDNSANYH